MKHSTEEFNFQGTSGDRLAGKLELPPSTPRAVAIFAHCFTCSKNVAAASRISQALARRGFAVLRFDFTGLGNSDGDFANTHFSSNVGDLEAAARALAARDLSPTLLVGHSLGGAAVLAAAGRIESVRAVATIGAPSEPSHVKHLFANDIPEIDAEGRARVTLAGRQFTLRKEFIDDIDSVSLRESLSKLGRALLIFHSPIDAIVGIDQAAEIYRAAKHPKSFISLDQADHMLSRNEDAEYVADTLAVWGARYLERPVTPSTSSAESGWVVVESTGAGFQQQVRTKQHQWLADEPSSVGGGGTGPNPYELLLASLGACTSMTLGMYATHKQWPLTSTTVRLKTEKIHAKDCEECDSDKGMIDRIDVKLSVEGELSAEQRSRLLEVAHRCPVHRTLTHDKQIRLSWDESQ